MSEMCIMGDMDLLSRNLTNSMAAYGIASLARWSFGSTGLPDDPWGAMLRHLGT